MNEGAYIVGEGNFDKTVMDFVKHNTASIAVIIKDKSQGSMLGHFKVSILKCQEAQTDAAHSVKGLTQVL